MSPPPRDDGGPSGPPRTAERLLEWLLPPGPAREGLLGDLAEEHADRVVRDGVARAHAWYWSSAAGLTSAYVIERTRTVFAGRRSSVTGPHSGTGLASIAADVRYAVRTLSRSRGFACAALVTMALGIGANTAVFAVVNGVLFRPLPLDDPDAVVAVDSRRFYGGREVAFLRVNAASLAAVGWLSPGWGYALGGGAEPTQIQAGRTSANILDVLGARPALGRAFLPGEDMPGREDVVILGHALWVQQFGSDPDVIGRRITLSGIPHEVVGVLPPDFGVLGTPAHDVWMPLPMDPSLWYYSGGALQIVGRLAEGFTLAQADAEAAALAGAMRAEFGETEDYAAEFGIVTLAALVVGDSRSTFLLLLGAGAFILLIAGANLGGLLLARTTGRSAEVTVRLSLGASRGRLIRQLVTESAVLSIVGGALGLVVAFVGVSVIVRLLPPTTPRLHEIAVDHTVLLACLGASIVTGLVFGLAPAVAASRTTLQRVLRETSGGSGTSGGAQRMRRAMVVAQIALAMVLLVGAGLMIRTLHNLGSVDPGFRTDGVLTMKLQTPGLDGVTQIYDDVRERVRALPAVRSVGTTLHFPIKESSWTARIEIEGVQTPPGSALPTATWRSVDEGFFAALAIPLVDGRVFDDRDGESTEQVVVVNQSLARLLFGSQPVVGQRIRPLLGEPDQLSTIVGVVGDVRTQALRTAGGPILYRPAAQRPVAARTLVVHTELDPNTLLGPIREAVWSVDPGIPISDVATVDQVLYRSIARPRVVAVLLGTFAGLGLVLGAVGVYGVIAYSVGRRTREIGVRMALGAEHGSVLGLVLRQGMALAAIGVVIGIAGAVLMGRFLASMVYGVPTTDVTTFAVLSFGLFMVAALATYLPARRAARIDPVEALRGS